MSTREMRTERERFFGVKIEGRVIRYRKLSYEEAEALASLLDLSVSSEAGP